MTHDLAALYNPVLPASLGGGEGAGTAGGTVIGQFISNVVGALLIIGFILSFITLLTGALQWITSGGDKAQLEQARNKITNAIIGLIILAAGWAVFVLVGQFLGITLPTITLPSFSG